MNDLPCATLAAWRDCLAANPEADEALSQKGPGRASIVWGEAVIGALAHGWNDGIRKSVDEVSFKQRFTPRRAPSL